MDNISQVIHNCETCAAIKQAKWVKPLWYGGRWLKYRYGEAWQIDYITLPQTCQGKRYVLTMVEATTGWLETYPVPHATARNTILGLEKQVLWRHGTPERIESDNGTHFKNGLINTWAREHGIEWIYHIPYHAPAAGKVERCNGLLKTTLKALGGGTFKNWELNLAKATWMVNTRGSINRAGPAQSEPLHTVDGDKVPVVHMKGILGKTVWINPTSSKGRPIRGIVFAQGPGSTWKQWNSSDPYMGPLLVFSAFGMTMKEKAWTRCLMASQDFSPVWAEAKTAPEKRPAETVDEEENVEEENDRGEEAYKGEEVYPEVNGKESGETVKEITEVEENKKKLNENYEDEAGETQKVDQAEEKELTHLNGKNNKENGEGMEHLNYQGDLQPEEEIKEDSGSQNQVDPGLENTSTNPRVTITSPQESEKNDQSIDCAAVA
ncbi:hypothetical protein DUI87_08456 [Hirundo rustica rustica]|uniref:Integrase catalytic domain-containing protein n=1 Tax=Hirundo rustica rustica TaxID=333673 RepID=A0A3M0KU88_HIRRU|nr:hypothetical protein DUI87_08456 [Hirundo rustica rustica]